jgi:predicted esterase
MARLLLLLCFLAALAQVPLSAAPAMRHVRTLDGERAYLQGDAPSGGPAPLLVFLHGDSRASQQTLEAYARQWEPAVLAEGWHLVLPWNEGKFSFHSDEGVRTLQAIVADYCRSHSVNPQRIYLVGFGDGAPGVFTAISRLPGLWAAAVAIGGDANLAIESNRLFAGNAVGIPLLWIYEESRASVLRPAIHRLQEANFPAQFEAASEFRAEHAIQWLSRHHAPALPSTVDYETGTLSFDSNRWVRIRELDFRLRNDVLASTRVDPGNGAFLRLGGFGYDPEGKGPGVPVKWLPENYRGPLQLDDTIVSIAGTMVENAAHYAEIMAQQRESRDVGIILLRNGKRTRIETRIVIPQRDEIETARILAEYLPESKEILVVSRGVRKAELRIPSSWAPVKVNWNGSDIAAGVGAGCLLLDSAPAPVAAPKHRRENTEEPAPVARPIPCESESASGGL